MTRREVWAWATLMGLLSLLLLSYMLLRATGGEGPVDQGYLDQLRHAGLLAGSIGILGTIGWAYEASR